MVFYFRFMAEGVFIDLVHTESEWSTTLFLGGDDVVRGCDILVSLICDREKNPPQDINYYPLE